MWRLQQWSSLSLNHVTRLDPNHWHLFRTYSTKMFQIIRHRNLAKKHEKKTNDWLSFALITRRRGRKAVLCPTSQFPLTKRCSRDPVPVGVKELLVAVHRQRRGDTRYRSFSFPAGLIPVYRSLFITLHYLKRHTSDASLLITGFKDCSHHLTDSSQGLPFVNFYKASMKSCISRSVRKGIQVILSPHWSAEEHTAPSGSQIQEPGLHF